MDTGPSFLKSATLRVDFSSRTQASALCLVTQQFCGCLDSISLLQCLYPGTTGWISYNASPYAEQKGYRGSAGRFVYIKTRYPSSEGFISRSLASSLFCTIFLEKNCNWIVFSRELNTSSYVGVTAAAFTTRHHRREDEREASCNSLR
jgi:hypothetical protein